MDVKTKSELCPTCEGIKLAGDKQCLTCFDTGMVYPGEPPCWYCGRSIQTEYKGENICGSKTCIEETDKLLNRRGTSSSTEGAASKVFGLTAAQRDWMGLNNDDDEETVRWKMVQFFN